MGGRFDWGGASRAAMPGAEQLWPEPKALDGKEGSSNVITTAADTPVTGARLVTLTPGRSVPMVFRCAVLLPNITSDDQNTLDFVARSTFQTIIGEGWLDIFYGAGAALQRTRIDLRTGTYQIPPSEEVTIALSTDMQEASALPSFTVVASLVPGTHPIPTTPTYTFRCEALPVLGGATVQVPARARYVDAWLANTSGTAKYGAGAPVLSLAGDISQAELIRDYSTGIFIPPYPAACIVTGYDGLQDRTLTLKTDVSCEACVQFYLEL